MFNKKIEFLLFGIFLFFGYLSSQVNWNWAMNAGGTNTEEGRCIAVDSSGNSFITGNFKDNATFGSTVLSAVFESDIFVAKLDAYGNWMWAVSVGHSYFDGGYDICLDANGDAYVTGYFGGNVSFGTTNLTSSGDSDAFVAKINTNGVWQWAVKAGGTGYDYSEAIEFDGNGDLLVTGYFSDTASFGSYSAISAGDIDVFVARLDNSGNWLGVLSAGGSSWEYSNGLSIDISGNVYITGGFYRSTNFGAVSLTGYGNEDIFVAKANSALTTWQWAKKAGGIEEDWGYAIATDSSGNSFITGEYRNTATFGNQNITALGYYSNLFVSKLDSSGDWLWTISAGGFSGYDEGYAIDIDDAGNSYITGKYRYTCSFGIHDVTSLGADDIFISKLNAAGNEWLWAISAGGSDGNDHGLSIFKADNDLLYATGYFRDAAAFGTINLTAFGYNDVFVAKLEDISPPPSPVNIQISIIGNQVNLSWDQIAGCTYTVYSDTDPEGSFETIEQTGITATSWTGNLQNSRKFYRVTAAN